jgi:peptidyl-prolyl cis-trans isomerase D
MMRDLREKTKIIMIVVALAFVGLMVFEWGMDISGMSVAEQTGEIGRVNGEPISAVSYSSAYQQLYDQARQQMGGEPLSREQVRQIEDRAFNEAVNEILMQQELRRRGIGVSDREVIQAAQWLPHPELMQNELFMTNGEFDINKYQQFLTGPTANEDLLLQLEQYYRSSIPRSKLLRQLTAGVYIGDAELWQVWRDQNETATVEYVQLSPSILVPGNVEVSEREVRTYYDQNREQFQRPPTARVTLAHIPKTTAAPDTVAALEEALALREEILAGADFSEVAARASDDQASVASGGDLGTFARGDMVAPFDSAVFSLPVGELSEPIATPFGFHLIEVLERTEEEARARHILLSYEASEDALDALYARADSLEMLAERTDVARAARIVGGSVQEGVLISSDQSYVAGVGSVLEAVEWVETEQLAPDPFDVSPVFETAEAFYLVELEAYRPAGQTPLSEATAEIERQLILRKKSEEARRIGQQMVTEIRGGTSLTDAARERGLAVDTAGPFSRIGFNPAFGQANAVTGAAFGVPIGEVSDVLETPGGLFIIHPLERTEADLADFEEQKDSLRDFILYQLQQEALARWMEELRREADIVDRRT